MHLGFHGKPLPTAPWHAEVLARYDKHAAAKKKNPFSTQKADSKCICTVSGGGMYLALWSRFCVLARMNAMQWQLRAHLLSCDWLG